MELRTSGSTVRQWKDRLQDRLYRPGLQRVLRTLGLAALSFFLSGASAAGLPLPLSVALTASLELGPGLFASYIGSCLGYARFWGMTQAMEPMASGLLVTASACVFDHISPSAKQWFGPFRAMLFTALVGFLFLVEQAFVPSALWVWLLGIGISGGGAHVFRKAMEEDSPTDRLFLAVSLCWGLCAIPLPGDLPLGAVTGAALTAAALNSPLSLSAAALSGLITELSWPQVRASAVLVLCTLVCRRWDRRLLQLSLWCLTAVAGVLLTESGPLFLVALVLAAPLSLLIPGQKLLGKPPVPEVDGQLRLQRASQLLRQLSQCLERPRSAGPDPELAVIFDHVAERVCRLCPLWRTCWKEQAASTLQALQQAAGPMMARGRLLVSDLPEAFVAQCRELPAFLETADRELEDLRSRIRCSSRLRESRQVLSRQYRALSDALTDAPPPAGLHRFRPELGVRGQGRRGASLSGDRGADFAVGRWYFVLLCDGMGAGEAASGESLMAVSLLEQLLRTGLDPEEALQQLNGLYLLRDDGGFSTVDLVRADLVTGEVTLYKWGSAPSYLKRRGQVEQIGSAQPPPGVGLGDHCRPDMRRLSLSRGEILVLTTDGLDREETENCLRQEAVHSAKDLAAAMVAARGPQEDDRTAVVLMLRSQRA